MLFSSRFLEISNESDNYKNIKKERTKSGEIQKIWSNSL